MSIQHEHQPGAPPGGATLSPREINDIYCLLDRTFLSPHSVARPQKIYVAVSVVCDIVCPYCPRQLQERSAYKHGLMHERQFQRIAPQMQYADYVGLFGLGEPFLHPKFFDFVRRVKEHGGPVATSSHGMSLSDEVIEKIIDSGIDKLAISMDGPHQKIFQRLRAGADFATVCANVKKLARRRRERGGATPNITIACTVSRHNFRYMPQMADLAAELGADELTFADLIIVDPRDAHLSVHNHPAFESRLKKARARAEILGLVCHYYTQFPYLWLRPARRREPGRFGCSEAYRTYEIDREGVVNPCCYIEEDYGNAFTDDFAGLPNHERRVQLRRDMLENTPHPTCASCQYLLKNSPRRVGLILDEVELRLRDPRLPREDKEQLEKLLSEYRQIAATFFDGDPETEYVEDTSLVFTYK